MSLLGSVISFRLSVFGVSVLASSLCSVNREGDGEAI